MDKVSIIVPVYNSEKYLKKCIDSLITQTYKNIEIILVDDGSKDKSGSICDRYATNDYRVRVFHNDNHGPSFSRNYGMDRASGEYITFVDDDDWLDKQAIELLLSDIKREDADVVFFNLREIRNDKVKEYKMFEENNIVFSGDKKEKLENILIIPEKYTDKLIMGLTGSFCKIYKCMSIKSCKFPENLRYAEDYCFIAQVIKTANTIIYSDKVLYNYRIRRDSLSHWIDNEFVTKNIQLVNWFLDFYKDDKKYKILNEFVFRYYGIVISNIIIDKKWKRVEKKRKIKEFLSKIDFDYDFRKVNIKCKNRNLQIEWFLIYIHFYLGLYLFIRAAKIKNYSS